MINYGSIALLYGGKSSERDISLKSGKAVFDSLSSQGFNIFLIDFIDIEQLATILKEKKINYCFIMLHGGDGENGTIQLLLEKLNIPYSGSNSQSCKLSFNKVESKKIWIKKNLITPKYYCVEDENDIPMLTYPLIIKPINEGSSFGISKIDHPNKFRTAYFKASKYGKVMAEEWVGGKELTVAIIGDTVLPSVWIEPKNSFYDYDSKYVSGSSYHCPSNMSFHEEILVKKIAMNAFNALCCSGWGRVDLILSEKKEFNLIEVNTVPGMTNMSLVPMAANYYGWDFDQLVLKIFEANS